MSTLHTVNKSPFDRTALTSCLDHLSPGDAVLLIEDAVVGAKKGSSVAPAVANALKGCSIYVLGPDLAARGLKAGDVVEGIGLVDYGGFVDLVANHDRTHSWL